MLKKLSGAENRKRKAQQERLFQESVKSMRIDKYVKIDKPTSTDNDQDNNLVTQHTPETDFLKDVSLTAELSESRKSDDLQTFNDIEKAQNLDNTCENSENL